MNSSYENENQMDIDGSSYYEDRSPFQPPSRGTKRAREPEETRPSIYHERLTAPRITALNPRPSQSGLLTIGHRLQTNPVSRAALLARTYHDHKDLVRAQRAQRPKATGPGLESAAYIAANFLGLTQSATNINAPHHYDVSAKASYNLNKPLSFLQKGPRSLLNQPKPKPRRFVIDRSRDSLAARAAFFGRSPNALIPGYLPPQAPTPYIPSPEEEAEDEESIREIASGWVVTTSVAAINLAVGLITTFLAWFNRGSVAIAEEIVAIQTAPRSNKRRAVGREIASPQGAVSASRLEMGPPTPDNSRPTTSAEESGPTGQRANAAAPSPPPATTSMPGSIPAADTVEQVSAGPSYTASPGSSGIRPGVPSRWAARQAPLLKIGSFGRASRPITPPEEVMGPAPMPAAAAPEPTARSIFEGMAEERKRLLMPSACKLSVAQRDSGCKPITSWIEPKPKTSGVGRVAESNKRLNNKTIKVTSRKVLATSKYDREIDTLVERATQLKIETSIIDSVRRNPRFVMELKEKVELEEADLQVKQAEAAKKAAEEEAAEKAKAAQEDALKKQRIIQPLSNDWTTKVNETMATTNPNKVLATAPSGAELRLKDFDCLLGTNHHGLTENWLNDEVVNGFLDAAVARELEKTGHKKSEPASVTAYHSGWYNTVQKNGIKAVSRWSRRKHIDGGKVLQTRKVLMPINTGAHWLIIIISPLEKKIEVLDSLHGSPTKYFEMARQWLAMELGDKFVAAEWTDANTRSSHQGNYNDCGAFTCFNALAAVKGVDYTHVQQADMQAGRRMIAAVLLNNGMTGDFEL